MRVPQILIRQVFTPRKKQLASFLLIAPALLAGVLILFAPQSADAANPTTINFQGKVVNADGTNVSNGTYSFTFQLYTSGSTDPNAASCASEATCVWEETQSSVTVTNGVFQVELGSVCPFFTSNACNESTPINFNTSNALYLTLEFDNDADGFMEPLMHFQSVPYAFNADRLGGIAASGFIQNSTSLQTTANFNIQSGASGSIGGIIRGASSQTADLFQLQNNGGNVLAEFDASGVLTLGDNTANVVGKIVLNNDTNNNTAAIQSGTTSSSYTLTLPTALPGSTECLKSDNAGTLTFGSCGTGGGGTLATSYSGGSTQADNTITLDTTRDGVIIQDASSPIGGELFTVQENGGTALFFSVSASVITMQDSGGNNALVFDSTTSELRIYENASSPTNYASITATNTTATFRSNTGTTVIGSDTGAITIDSGSGAAINITGHAASVWQTDAGSLTIQGGSTLSLLSTTSSAASLDSGSTGDVNIGTGSNAKTVTIGNTTGATAVTINAGTGTIGIGTSAHARTIDLGTGAAVQTITVGSQNSTSSLVLQGGSSNISLLTTGNIVIGTSDTTGTLLVLDTKTDSGDPSGINGGTYYNSNSGRFRCYQGAAWKNCDDSWTTARVTGSNATTTGQSLTDVTGLSVALSTNRTYEFEAILMVQASATTGNQYAVNYSVAGGAIEAQISGTLAAATSRSDRITALNTATPTYVTSGSTGGIRIQGIVTTGANAGNLVIRHLKVTSGTSTVFVNSFLKVREL